MTWTRRTLLGLGLLGALALPAGATEERAREALEVSRLALGHALPDITLRDTNGRAVRLSDFRGRPLLVTLVYTSCADVCPTLLQSLYPAIKAAQGALGPDSFSVITVGFDTRNDSIGRMRSFARGQGVDLPNWQFLAADEKSLDQLARAVGFAFYSRPGGFDHLSQVSFVDAEGRLYQQVYGAVFEPPLVVEPLKALVLGRERPLTSLDVLVDRIKYFCTVYDPRAGRYYFNYSLFMNIGIGTACFSLVLFLLLKEWRRAGQPRNGRG